MKQNNEGIMKKNITILSVFGTRPEAIKMAPLVNELNKCDNITSLVCVTAQHREMLDQVLNGFNIIPDFDLNIMGRQQTLKDITIAAMDGLDLVIKKCTPDLILVHGDTTTTFAASLAAFYNKVPIGHVEAGLRTFDKYSPFPEEINRRMTDAVCDLYFAPTQTNKENLLNENFSKNIFITGNTVIDAIGLTVKSDFKFSYGKLNSIDYNKKIILVTAHRRENWGTPMQNIMQALKQIALEFSDVIIVYPVHLNPIVKELAYSILSSIENILLIDPIDVFDMHNLMSKSYFVLTDSGGLQEEAPSLGKPVLVMRSETERPEAVKAGTVKIVGTDKENIYQSAKNLLTDNNEYLKMARAINPYGDGLASKRIIEAIQYYFNLSDAPPKDFIPK